MRRRLRRACRWLIIAGLQASACGAPPDDSAAAIEALIARAEVAAQAGDVGALGECLHPDFRDASGRDRRAMIFMLRALIGRYARMEIIVRDIETDVLSPQLANVQLTLIAIARDGNRPLPAALGTDRRRLRLALRADRDGWRVTRAEWSGAGAD